MLPPPRRPDRNRSQPTATALAVLVAAPLGVLVLADVAGLGNRSLLVLQASSLRFEAAAATFVVVALAGWSRSRRLQSFAVVALLAGVLTLWPDRPSTTAVPVDADIVLRVVAANLFQDNVHLEDALAAIASRDADIVVLHEVQPADVAVIRASTLAERLPHAYDRPASGASGEHVRSRHPIVAPRRVPMGDRRTTVVQVRLPDTTVSLVSVHASAPKRSMVALRDELHDLAGIAAGLDGPTVLAGDFNASAEHAPFRALLGSGLTDAHRARGRGLDTSWPIGDGRIPFVLLDHILVDDGFTVVDADTFTISGSDHRGVEALLALDG